MSDGFKTNIPPDSEEFENLEKAQAAPAKPVQSKPQEGFDVKDEVGKALETAQQAITGPTDPAKIQQQQAEQAKKKQDDQQKIGRIKTFLNQMAQDEQRLKQQRQKEQQTKMEETQVEKEEAQVKEMKKQKKEQSFNEQHIRAEQTKAERKLGVGG